MATASRIQSNCGLCLQPYKRPKILPCFHSYCETCLASHISKANTDSKFQCPLCRADIDIPDSGASFFQTNFYIDTIEEDGKDSEEVSCLCENCDGGTKPSAAYYCEVCEQKICEECALLHKKLKITRDHDLASLKTVRSKKFHQEKCFKHETKFADRYCNTCEEFLCSSCDYDVHDQHNIELIDAAANLKRNRLNKELIACEKFCANEKFLKIISQRESAVEEMERKAKDHLHERAVEIKMDIDVNVKKIENEIMKICEDKKDKLKQLKKDVESTQEKTVPLKKWITSASDTEVLREGDRILCKIKVVNASSPKSIPDIQLVRFERNCHKIDSKSIGLVVTDKKTLSTTKIEIVSAFCTPQFNEIKCIMQCQDGKVWIAETGTKGLTLFNEWGSENKKILEQFEIASVAMSNDGILFISVPEEKLIYKITENNKASKHFSLASIPGDIAVFDNGNLAVCCNEPAKLLIIDQSGQVVRQYAPRGSKFKALHCVAVCKFTDILAVCAQDIVDSGTAMGRLSTDAKKPVHVGQAFAAPSFGSFFDFEQVEKKQSSSIPFTFGSSQSSLLNTRDDNKTPQNSRNNTKVKGKSPQNSPKSPTFGSFFDFEQVEKKQSSSIPFTFGSSQLSLLNTRDDNKTPQNSPNNTKVKGKSPQNSPKSSTYGSSFGVEQVEIKQSSSIPFTFGSSQSSLLNTRDNNRTLQNSPNNTKVKGKSPQNSPKSPTYGSSFGVEQVEIKQSSSIPFTYGYSQLSLLNTRDDNKTPQNSPNNTEVKGNIFLFDQKGNMMTKIKRQAHHLIFDSQGHLLVSLDKGNIDVLDYRGNILACLSPNGGDFLSGKMALDSLNRLWIGESGRINVFIYPDVILYTKDEDQ